jgi:hypothetical protein
MQEDHVAQSKRVQELMLELEALLKRFFNSVLQDDGPVVAVTMAGVGSQLMMSFGMLQLYLMNNNGKEFQENILKNAEEDLERMTESAKAAIALAAMPAPSTKH